MEKIEQHEARVSVSQHCKERYAERIMGKDTKLDIKSFISQNEDKICNDISKMVWYGTLIYTGPTSDAKRIVKVYRCDTWLVLVGADNNTAITLFKIDLGIGAEFDRRYIDEYLKVIEQLQSKVESVKEDIEYKKSDYMEIIRSSEEEIAEYRRCIKNLESLVEAYKETVNNLNAEIYAVELEVKKAINKLLGKKTF